MNPIIQNLLDALGEIDQAHYETAHARVIDVDMDVINGQFSTYENNFTSQLNEKYAILSHIKRIEEPSHLIRQLQIPKKYIFSEHPDELVKDTYMELADLTRETQDNLKQLMTIPDFIIHKSQENKDMQNQRLIAEVKTAKNLGYDDFAWDFFKLCLYLNKYNFQTACFIAVNNSPEKIRRFVSQYLETGLYRADRGENLFIIMKESYSSSPEVDTLDQIE